MKTEHIVVKATKEFKEKVKQVAVENNKTLSGYVTDCILSDLKKEKKNGK